MIRAIEYYQNMSFSLIPSRDVGYMIKLFWGGRSLNLGVEEGPYYTRKRTLCYWAYFHWEDGFFGLTLLKSTIHRPLTHVIKYNFKLLHLLSTVFQEFSIKIRSKEDKVACNRSNKLHYTPRLTLGQKQRNDRHRKR